MSGSCEEDLKLKTGLFDVQFIEVEPIGQAYENYITGNFYVSKIYDHVVNSDTKNYEFSANTNLEENNCYTEFLNSLKPNDWKNQDHYAVLGLGDLRYFATEDNIKKMYHQKVLKYHPDKQIINAEKFDEINDKFICISKAYEILGNPIKRAAYDSVDPYFNNDIPECNAYSKAHFFEVFEPVFERNARWSLSTPVPILGNEDTPRNEVEDFYSFWYNFKSWREFSYLDEEEKEKGQDREERKWIDKTNRAARMKRKKEEMSRIRNLVDNAFKCDPRIQQFKKEDKNEKEMIKQAKKEQQQKKLQNALEKQEMDLLQKQHIKTEIEKNERLLQEQMKKEREIIRKNTKKERKVLRNLLQEVNYFSSNESERIQIIVEIECFMKTAQLEKLQTLNIQLKNSNNYEEKKQIILKEVDNYKKYMLSKYDENIESTNKVKCNNSEDKPKVIDKSLLIRAVNLYPAGTVNRWDTITTFINEHCNIHYTSKEVLAQTQEIKNLRLNNVCMPCNSVKGNENKVWSIEEQKLLEQALRTFPSSTQNRWEKISKCIPQRSAAECIQRYKELIEFVRQKKKIPEMKEKRNFK